MNTTTTPAPGTRRTFTGDVLAIAPDLNEGEIDPWELDCKHCDHCMEEARDSIRYSCTVCKGGLDEDQCENCLITFVTAGASAEALVAVYTSSQAQACMSRRSSNVSALTREGWCYLPAGHLKDHYFLTEKDVTT